MTLSALYPGYKYLGPGNKLDNGQPVNSTDAIAQVHDYEYNEATSESEVFKSDEKAISDFALDYAEHGRFSSLVGAAGLGIKHFVESNITGVIYPTGNGTTNIFP
jgi:Phospholipase A2-like domain